MGMTKKFTAFEIMKPEAERLTGLKYTLRKEAGKKVTLFSVDADGNEKRLMYGTMAAAGQFIEGVIYAMNLMNTPEKRREVHKSVQAEYDFEDIMRAAGMKDVKLSDEQAKRAVKYFDDHFSADVDEWTQRCDAIDAILAEDGLKNAV